MKTYIYTYILVLLCTYTMAQTHCSEIENTTTTDWRRTDGGNNNTFDWTRNDYDDVFVGFIVPNTTINSIPSPFYDETSCDGANNAIYWCFSADIPGQPENIQNDVWPEDGWELIFRNIGLPDNPTINPRFAIYNRHRGILRYFMYINYEFTQPWCGLIKLQINDVDYYENNAMLSVNQNITKALDNSTPNILIATPQFVTPQWSMGDPATAYWVYADFAVTYDPCTCEKDDLNFFANSGQIKIEVDLISGDNNSLYVDLSLIGDSINTETRKIIDGNPFDTKIDKTSALLGFDNKYYNYSKYSIDESTYGTFIKDLKKFQKNTSINNSNKYLQKKYANQYNLTTSIEGGLLAGDKGILLGENIGLANMSIMGGSINSGTQVITPNKTILSINNDINDHKPNWITSSNFTFSASTIPSQINSTAKVKYNNILGVYNVLETPKMEYALYQYVNKPNNKDYQMYQVKIKDPVKYVINKAANLTTLNIYSAIVIKPRKANFGSVTNVPFSEGNNGCTLNFDAKECNYLAPPFTLGQFGTTEYKYTEGINRYEQQLNASGIEIHNWIATNTDCSTDGVSNIEFNTPFIPISQLENMSFLIPAKYLNDVDFELKTVGYFETPEGKVVQLVYTFALDKNTTNLPTTKLNYKIVDAKGQDIRDVSTATYNCTNTNVSNLVAEYTNGEPTSIVGLLEYRKDYFLQPIDPSPFATVGNNYFATNLLIENDTLTTPQNVNAWGNIILNNVTVANNANVNFYAGLGIDVTGNSDLGTNSTLNINSNPALLPNVVSPVTSGAELTDFCKNKYAKIGPSTNNPPTAGTNPVSAIELYPNPNTGRATLKFALNADSEVSFDIFDVTGKLLATVFNKQEVAAGIYKFDFSTDQFSPGIYLCVLQTAEGTKTVRMVVQ